MEEKNEVKPEIPENFRSTITDFAKDLQNTFPEVKDQLKKWCDEETPQESYNELFTYCLGIYPPRFFDILNQNEDIFKETQEGEESYNTCFLPNIDFKQLYYCEGVTKTMQETIWKYLQLLLFSLVGTMKDKMDFGDAMGMFNDMEKDDLEGKLQEAMSNIHDFFSNMEEPKEGESETPQEGASQSRNMPAPEDIHSHLMGLFDGKIGKLAKELASDLTGDLEGTLGINLNDATSSKDVLKSLLKNPNKISGLVKTVGEKLNDKMASGEISQQDLLKEAGSMMKKMKDMGGGDMGSMFQNMAKTMGMNMPKGARFDTNAFSQMQKNMEARENMKQNALDAQLRKDADELAKAQEFQQRKAAYDKFMAENPNIFDTNDPNSLVYRLEGEEKQQKSGLKPPGSSGNKNKKKKKKGKK